MLILEKYILILVGKRKWRGNHNNMEYNFNVQNFKSVYLRIINMLEMCLVYQMLIMNN